jgi:hypothetical protein
MSAASGVRSNEALGADCRAHPELLLIMVHPRGLCLRRRLEENGPINVLSARSVVVLRPHERL